MQPLENKRGPRAPLDELGHSNEQQGGESDGNSRVSVEGVYLCSQLASERSIVDALQAGAVDVPDAALPYISQALAGRCEETVGEKGGRRDRQPDQRCHIGCQEASG